MSQVTLEQLAAQVSRVSKDLSVKSDNPEPKVLPEPMDRPEPRVFLVSSELPVKSVSLETLAHVDLADLLDFRVQEGSQVTLEQVVKKVRLDHKVLRVSLAFRDLSDSPATKVSLEILDFLDNKDL